jgi:two-component system, NtrC family, response regulator AtoC
MLKYPKRVLICEDEPEVSHCLEMAIKSLGCSVQAVRNGDEVRTSLQNSEVEFSALFLGVTPDRPLELLREIRAIDTKLPVIVVASLWSTRAVVAALRSGATDVLCTPIIQEELISVLAAAFEAGSAICRSGPRNGGSLRTFESANPGIRAIESRVAKIGWSGAPVLIQGETGSGKEILARRLHTQSARANKPFLKLNCAALPSELVESELFGYERGAFTGAFERKAGIFELADGGTILLDEIGDMDVRLQAKLLQVLQDQEFRRIGGKETVKVNVRIMAATHRDLERAIYERIFREDLYYRLNVIVLHLPPLRERTEDIVSLGEFLLTKHADPDGPVPEIGASLRNAMMLFNWPGNVRELENYMRKLVIFRDSDALASELSGRALRKPFVSIRPADGPAVMIDRPGNTSALEQVTNDKRQAETNAILVALDSTYWNRKQAAAILKIDYKPLLYRMKKLGIGDGSASFTGRSNSPLRKAATGD